MASLRGEYDTEAGTPGDFDTFEAGVYPVELTESDIVATKAGTGKMFKYRVRITQGDLTDRLVFGQMNIQNKSPIAAKIGSEEFRALREIVGVMVPEDTTELHFIEFPAVVKVTPAKGEYKAKNEINWGATYKLFSSGEAPPVAANDNTPPAKAANDNKAPPAKGAWPKKAA
jgi:hypothetical protein